MALANAQRQNGKTDHAEFVLDKGSKKISDLLETTWEVNSMEGFYLIVWTLNLMKAVMVGGYFR